ncbi:MAG: tetratricopeptide repeat protein [Opitutae bacterium]|nr:tetratricopeptide repeat protein [Opitutae bacterium]
MIQDGLIAPLVWWIQNPFVFQYIWRRPSVAQVSRRNAGHNRIGGHITRHYSPCANDCAAAHNDLGVLYYRAGDMDQAEAHYRRAAALAPAETLYRKNLADFLSVARGKVQEALEIAKDVLKDHEGMHPDFPPRVFFNEFNTASLNLFVIYWYHPADYWQYMAFSEKVNMELLRRFNEAGIEFAFPTQTLYLAGDPARPLNIGGLEGLPG